MELVYASEKVETQCTSMKAARKLFGGDTVLAISLLARINALEMADTIRDIIVQPAFHFHNLHKKEWKKSGRILCDRCEIEKGAMAYNSSAT